MQLDARFVINDHTTLSISVPEKKKKFTYYYAPTSTLHRFDESPARCIGSNMCLELYREHIHETMISFYNILIHVLQYDTTIAPYVSPGCAGKELYKITSFPDIDSDALGNILVWGHCLPIYTLLYKISGCTYLEIAPAYHWRRRPMRSCERHIYIPFETYLYTYKPYVYEELSHNTVNTWYEQCCQILASFD